MAASTAPVHSAPVTQADPQSEWSDEALLAAYRESGDSAFWVRGEGTTAKAVIGHCFIN